MSGANPDEQVLGQPDAEQAAHILRELPTWDERIPVTRYDPGPGVMLHNVFSLTAMRNMMRTFDTLRVDYDQLVEWVGNTIGDAELASAMSSALEAEDSEHTEELVALLTLRIDQCEAVLAPSEELEESLSS